MAFNSGLTGFNPASGCPSGPGNGRRGVRDILVPVAVRPAAASPVTIASIAHGSGVTREKRHATRSCAADDFRIDSLSMKLFSRMMAGFESRHDDKQKFGDMRENVLSRELHSRAVPVAQHRAERLTNRVSRSCNTILRDMASRE